MRPPNIESNEYCADVTLSPHHFLCFLSSHFVFNVTIIVVAEVELTSGVSLTIMTCANHAAPLFLDWGNVTVSTLSGRAQARGIAVGVGEPQ